MGWIRKEELAWVWVDVSLASTLGRVQPRSREGAIPAGVEHAASTTATQSPFRKTRC